MFELKWPYSKIFVQCSLLSNNNISKHKNCVFDWKISKINVKWFQMIIHNHYVLDIPYTQNQWWCHTMSSRNFEGGKMPKYCLCRTTLLIGQQHSSCLPRGRIFLVVKLLHFNKLHKNSPPNLCSIYIVVQYLLPSSLLQPSFLGFRYLQKIYTHVNKHAKQRTQCLIPTVLQYTHNTHCWYTD